MNVVNVKKGNKIFDIVIGFGYVVADVVKCECNVIGLDFFDGMLNKVK